MTATLLPWVAAYLCAGFAVLALLAARDRWGEVRAALWLCLLWPLTLIAVVVLLAVLGLKALGFDFQRGRPRAGIRWDAGWVKPESPRSARRRHGFWLACPLQVVAVSWSRPDWWPA